MDIFKRAQCKDVGPGGWKCRCCVKPKDRPRLRRVARTRIKAETKMLAAEVL